MDGFRGLLSTTVFSTHLCKRTSPFFHGIWPIKVIDVVSQDPIHCVRDNIPIDRKSTILVAINPDSQILNSCRILDTIQPEWTDNLWNTSSAKVISTLIALKGPSCILVTYATAS